MKSYLYAISIFRTSSQPGSKASFAIFATYRDPWIVSHRVEVPMLWFNEDEDTIGMERTR